MRKLLFGLTAVVILSFASCDLFSNSWGENLARDPGTLTVTAGNVKELLREAKGDTKTSRGILDKIAGQLDSGNPNPTLQAAAVTAANQASGLGMVVLDNADILLSDDIPDEETFNELLKSVQDSTKGSDLKGISDDIAKALPVDAGGGAGPQFKDDFNASNADLTLLALTLVMAEVEKNEDRQIDFDDYIKTWTSGEKNINTAAGLTDGEKVIAAITHKVASDPDSTLGAMLEELLGGKRG
jgi:hypothetical protein